MRAGISQRKPPVEKCSHCGEDIEPGQKRCFACGADRREKIPETTIRSSGRRRVIWFTVSLLVVVAALIAVRVLVRSAQASHDEGEADVEEIASVADEETDSNETSPALPGSALLVAEYNARTDLLLERLDRIRQKLADAEQLEDEDSVALQDIRSQLEDIRPLINALARAASQESQDSSKAALDEQLSVIRDQLDDLDATLSPQAEP